MSARESFLKAEISIATHPMIQFDLRIPVIKAKLHDCYSLSDAPMYFKIIFNLKQIVNLCNTSMGPPDKVISFARQKSLQYIR